MKLVKTCPELILKCGRPEVRSFRLDATKFCHPIYGLPQNALCSHISCCVLQFLIIWPFCNAKIFYYYFFIELSNENHVMPSMGPCNHYHITSMVMPNVEHVSPVNSILGQTKLFHFIDCKIYSIENLLT